MTLRIRCITLVKDPKGSINSILIGYWFAISYSKQRPCPSSTANHSTPCKSISGAISSCTWLATRGFSASTRIHRGVASFTMGKRKDRREYSSRKRKFCGNQHSSGVSRGKRQKLSETEVESYSAAETENVNIDPSVSPPSPPKPSAFSSASGEKLKNRQQEELEFDKDDLLTGFRFVDIELLVDFVKKLLCPACKRPLGQNTRLSHVTEHRTNQASKVVFTCQCQQTSTLFTSKKSGKVYEANRRFPLAIFSIGKHHTGAKRFLGNMNMPPPALRKSWRNHKKQIHKATTTVAAVTMQEAAQEVKTEDSPTCVKVSCDGTWHRRGFSSKNGIATVLSVNGKNSKVLDTETLSNYCDSCAKQKHMKTDAEFQAWLITHQDACQKNHTGSAASMEPSGMETVFRRSVERYDLQYTEYLGDGDSKSYARVKNADPAIYDGVQISKLECCGHVQKRMGRQLTNRVAELKSTTFRHNGKPVKGIGGRAGLKKAAILKIQGHFGAAIRQNSGDLRAMKKAIWAIFEHRNRQHDNCGQWCPSKKVNGGDPNKNSLPPYVMEAIRPVFETLTDDSLLQKCLHGGTQNSNESFHHLIWEGCPKTTFCGRERLELAVADATVVYNCGEVKRVDIFRQLNIQPGYYAMQCFKDLDGSRVLRACAEGMVAAKQQRRQRALDNAELGMDTEYFYLSGAHE